MENSQRWVLIIAAAFVAIGAGCGIWLGFFHDWHETERTVSIEERHNETVGAKVLPKEPVQITLKNRQRNGCVVLDRVEFDGSALWAYYHAACPAKFVRWIARQKSPDGTILGNWYMWIVAEDVLYAGDHGEIKSNSVWELDPRTVTIETWAEN